MHIGGNEYSNMSSVSSDLFVAWACRFSSSESHSLAHDPNLSSLDDTKFVFFLPHRFQGGDLILG
jgi:hypothetical protein